MRAALKDSFKGLNVSGGDSSHLWLWLLWSQDFPPVFTVMTFCVQSGLFQQNIQSVLLAIMPCLHHTITSMLQEFHTRQSTTQYILNALQLSKSASHGMAAELNTMGSGRLHSQDCIVKRGKININILTVSTIFLNTLTEIPCWAWKTKVCRYS